MGLTSLFGLLGGLALFLYGMHMMSSGMEAAAGDKMKSILEKLTSNRFLGVFVGMIITAIIQSSSATTVMVVGFVNSSMMTLSQAVWVIMGANIGTTITGQLIALDIGAIAPLIAFFGVVLVVFMKKPKVHHIGSIFAGLGVLFIGMDMMSDAMMPLRESEAFVNVITKFSNPLVGILAGMIFTAIIQSSSASVGILQALAASGVIPFSNAVYVLFGQNIGTCITAILASIGTNKNAKRTTIIHLSFNIIGTTIFTIVCMLTPLTSFVGSITPNSPVAQIANMHTFFNIATTLLLLPFGNMLARFAEKVLKDDVVEEGKDSKFLCDIRNGWDGDFGISAISIEQIYKEIRRMLSMAKDNVHDSFTAFFEGDVSKISQVEEKEEYIDYLNWEISKYIASVMTHETNINVSETLSGYYKITSNVERIGDHAVNICQYTNRLKEKKIGFSEIARGEIQSMKEICDKLIDVLDCEEISNTDIVTVESMEQEIDDMTLKYRDNMLRRISAGTCSEEGGVIYSEMLTDFERIGDHALNISEELKKIKVKK